MNMNRVKTSSAGLAMSRPALRSAFRATEATRRLLPARTGGSGARRLVSTVVMVLRSVGTGVVSCSDLQGLLDGRGEAPDDRVDRGRRVRQELVHVVDEGLVDAREGRQRRRLDECLGHR